MSEFELNPNNDSLCQQLRLTDDACVVQRSCFLQELISDGNGLYPECKKKGKGLEATPW
jgi:hypothetical protein